MHWSEVWEGRGWPFFLLRVILIPLSWIYAAGWILYERVYQIGLKRSISPCCPIVCVGNLMVGGSGKTPLVLYLTQILKGLGYEVVLSCSGYGSPSAKNAQIAPGGSLSARQWGDEPAMIRWLNPELPLIVGRDRVLAAKLCAQNFSKSVLLLDDGYQHLPLKKNFSLLLEDSGMRNRNCLPAGPYRQPYSGLRKADLVLDKNNRLKIKDGLNESPFSLKVMPPFFLTKKNEQVEKSAIRGKKVQVLCAIGRPNKFLDALKKCGFELSDVKLLADHDQMTNLDLLSSFSKDDPIIVTAKDWVKLKKNDASKEREIWIAHYEVRVDPENDFKLWLKHRIDEISC